jgi:hypothetical protein
MAQIVDVLKGDPDAIVSQLTVIAATSTIEIVEATFSASQYLVVYNNSVAGGQTVIHVKGDPSTIVDAISALVSSSTKVLLCPTYSKFSFILVYN